MITGLSRTSEGTDRVGRHSAPKNSWMTTAVDFARACATPKRVGRYGAASEANTATGVLRTVRRRPMVAAIALPAAATAGIVASTAIMGPPETGAGTVSAEQSATSTQDPTAAGAPTEAETTDDTAAAEAEAQAAYDEYVASLKEDDRYDVSAESGLKAVPTPTKTATAASASAAGAASSSGGGGGVSNAPCSVSSSIESGLRPNAVAAYRAVCAKYPQVKSYGGRRNDPGSDHNSGQAVDIMITGGTGDSIAQYLIDNQKALNVKYVIWKQRIWMPGRGWKGMSDRGSVTANHFDHVHVSVN